MISFKSNFKSDYNKMIESKDKEKMFKSKVVNEIRVSYGLNSERTRSSNDRFTKVVLSK